MQTHDFSSVYQRMDITGQTAMLDSGDTDIQIDPALPGAQAGAINWQGHLTGNFGELLKTECELV